MITDNPCIVKAELASSAVEKAREGIRRSGPARSMGLTFLE
jgi:hypothetical protein